MTQIQFELIVILVMMNTGLLIALLLPSRKKGHPIKSGVPSFRMLTLSELTDAQAMPPLALGGRRSCSVPTNAYRLKGWDMRSSGYTWPITTHAQLEQLLTLLEKQGKSFHCEDNANEIVHGQTGERTFTNDEAMYLNQRMWEAYELDWDGHPDGCPCGMVIRIGKIGEEVNDA